MSVKLFDTGTVCNVVQIFLPAADFIKMLFQCNGDEFRGVSPVGIFEVILIFKQFLGIGKLPEYLCNQILLFFGGVPELMTAIHFFYAVAGGDVFDEVT
ncbi:hypothetical protein SDC9_90827 [bioreactor metagenome]|uniref:Uncharacterized protein n=1 Tax=bioreactor metagenome TaxID=1076179 RepID=A0A644ZT20_9ZZZZ